MPLSNFSDSGKMTFLLTGATGFLGKSFGAELNKNHSVITLGRSAHNDIICDLSENIPRFPSGIDCVVHNAGKAHVLPSGEAEAQSFFDVNTTGTLNLLKGLDLLVVKPKGFIFVSTVAVYGLEEGRSITEDSPLAGNTPYALSKIQAEKAISGWCAKHKVNCVILRLPLVAGKAAPGNLASIYRAIKKGYYFKITGNEARKSMVLDQDIARLIPGLATQNGVYHLTDDQDPFFGEVEDAIAFGLGKTLRFSLPIHWVKTLARVGDFLTKYKIPAPLNSRKLLKITTSLTFSCAKAKREIGWNPHPVLPFIRSNYKP